ncbi:DUF4407 domain-containing protein [Prescottella equi]
MNDPNRTGPHSLLESAAAVETSEVADTRADTRDESPASGNPGGQFLLWCAGANPKHLHEIAERRWYHSLGASVIFTAVVAGASAYVLMLVCFELSWQTMAAISVAWAMVVFNLDRLIVSRVLGRPSFWNKTGLFLSRFVLVIGVALMMAVGVEMIIFSPEIGQKIIELNVEAQAQREAEARRQAETEFAAQLAAPGKQAETLKLAVSEATTARNDADRREKCESDPKPELNCQSGTGDRGPGNRTDDAALAVNNAQAHLESVTAAYNDYAIDARPTGLNEAELEACGHPAGALLTRQQEQECAARQRVEARVQEVVDTTDAQNDKGMIRRLAALAEVARDKHGFWVTALRILIFIVVASIDLIPLSAKLFGGTTGHDMRARRDFITASDEYMADFNAAKRKEPHFLDKTRATHRVRKALGFAPDYDEAAAKARSDHYAALFERQGEILKASWPQPTRSEQVNGHPLADPEEQTASQTAPTTPNPHTPVYQGEGLYAGKVLTAKNGAEFRLGNPLSRANTNDVNQLWRCKRIDRDDDRDYLAKCCTRKGHRGLVRDAVVAQLSSPRVIKIVSGPSVAEDLDSGYYFIVMPYFEDGDLDAFQKRFRAFGYRVPLSIALSVTRQMLEGLGDVHESGAVHCDIKPQNILLDLSNGDANPEIVITDFGAMKLMKDHHRAEATQVFGGTEPYAAPEQLLTNKDIYGRRAHATDLWAVGAVLFKMLTNFRPRDLLAGKPEWAQGDDKYKQWLREAPEVPRLDELDPSIPEPIADIVARWLSKEPRSRVSEGLDIEAQNSRAVMDDALAQLDEAMVMSR